MQRTTSLPVQFEITQSTREAVSNWIKEAGLAKEDYGFPNRMPESPHIGTRQYARIVDGWINEIGLDPSAYGTHSMRRTKESLIFMRTKILGPFSCSWGTPSWRVRFDIWVSRWNAHLKWQSRPKIDQSCADDSEVQELRIGVGNIDWTALSGRWRETAPGPYLELHACAATYSGQHRKIRCWWSAIPGTGGQVDRSTG